MNPVVVVYSTGNAEQLKKSKPNHVLAQAANGHCDLVLAVHEKEAEEYNAVAELYDCELFIAEAAITTMAGVFDEFMFHTNKGPKTSRYIVFAEDNTLIHNKQRASKGLRVKSTQALTLDPFLETTKDVMQRTNAAIGGVVERNNAFIAEPFYERNKRIAKVYCVDRKQVRPEWVWDYPVYSECRLLLALLYNGKNSVSLTNYMHSEPFSNTKPYHDPSTYLAAAKELQTRYPRSVALQERELNGEKTTVFSMYLKKDFGSPRKGGPK